MLHRLTILFISTLFATSVFADGGSTGGTSGLGQDFDVVAGENRTFELYASDKTAQVRYDSSKSPLDMEGSRMMASFLYNEERDLVFSAGVNLDVEPEFLSGFTFSVGTKGYAALLALENSDVVAVAVGIEGAYTLPLEKFPLQFDAALYYAPDIFTFGQSDRVVDWNVRVGLAINDRLDVFTGVRFLQFDTFPGERELDKRAHIGIRWTLENK